MPSSDNLRRHGFSFAYVAIGLPSALLPTSGRKDEVSVEVSFGCQGNTNAGTLTVYVSGSSSTRCEECPSLRSHCLGLGLLDNKGAFPLPN